MVGQANSINSSLLQFFGQKDTSKKLTVKETIILSLGLIDRPINVKTAYTLTKTLARRIRSHLAFNIPNYESFNGIITKLQKEGIVRQSYLLEKKSYGLELTEMGYGSYDSILYSISQHNITENLNEFRELVNIAF